MRSFVNFSDQHANLASRFRTGRPDRTEDIDGGLNKMTVACFEAIVRQSGMRVKSLHAHSSP